MSAYGWTNDDGEPIMDGAAYRFEQQLDAEYDEQRGFDPYDDDGYYDEDDEDEDEDDGEDDELVAPAVLAATVSPNGGRW